MTTVPLRVAYVLLRAPAYSETFISGEIEAVRESGQTVEVFHAREPGESRRQQLARTARTVLLHPFKVFRHVRLLGFGYGPRAVLASAYALHLAKAVRRFRPDVIHTHFVNLPVAMAVLIGQELGVPATALAHAADFLLDGNPTALERRLLRLRHLFVISAAAARQLAGKGVDMQRIPHSIVRASFDGTLLPGRATGGSPTRLITIARLIDKKGVDTAIAAVGRLHALDIKVQYDVYGDGPLLGKLTAHVAAAGLTDVVRLHGAAPHAEVMTALAEADVAVLPCRHAPNGDIDGIPVFLMEAAGRGVPVVTTSVSGIPELVRPEGGWTVPPDDPQALAEALIEIVDRPEEAHRRVTELRERIATEFAPDLQAQRLVIAWARLAGKPLSTLERA